MRFKFLFAPILFIVCFMLLSCVNNSEEYLYGEDCDTLDLTYTRIKYIFEDNCYACHTVPQGYLGIKLNSYTDLKAAVGTNRLVGAINHKNGYVPMPNGQPKLSDCQIDKIEAWINAGMPE